MAPDATAQRVRAATLLDLNRPAEARALLEPLVAVDPGDARAMGLLGRCHQLEGNFPRAYDLCRAAVAVAPDDVDVLIGCADVARQSDYGHAAVGWASHAVALAPVDVRALQILSLAEVADNKPTSALTHATKALATEPNDAEVRVAYAMALDACAREVDAVEQYVTVLRHWPENVNALNNLAALRLAVGDLRRSGRLFSRALAINPRLTVVSRNMDLAGEVGRRVLAARLALVFGILGIARHTGALGFYVIGGLLLGTWLWSVVRTPAPVLRRLSRNLRPQEIWLDAILGLAVVVTCTPWAETRNTVILYSMLLIFGFVVSLGVWQRRSRLDLELRRRGIRLPT